MTIEDRDYENDHLDPEESDVIQKIMMDKKMNKRKLREQHPEIAEELKLFYKHCDIRLHNYFFRKCHKHSAHVCPWCRDHPVRSSDKLWSCLPPKSSGALFFDCEEDPNNLGHNRTLLDLLKDIKTLKIIPDGQYEGFMRCKEKGCLCSFKSDADADRHCRIAHGEASKKNISHVCRFKVDGVPCGAVYDKKWDLTKHKNKEGHVKRQARKKNNS